ncbi:hypothetical protein [Capnocytophaga leadbetteri]|uniref:hypothetical protein n=1 Tax=Capnocytophaga leadbetteri TaxID=327575 RepID=UPI0026EFF00D|nr:hypothetical protein [Capnocytophaga leadbetteri]
MKNIFKQWAFVALTIAVVLIGCKKDDEQPQPQPQQQYETLALSTQSTTTFILVKGATQTFTITAGSGDYSVTSEKTNVVTATLSTTVVTINAKAEGDTKVIVKDNKSNQSKELMFSVVINPSIKWQKTINGSEDDEPIAIIKTNDGGFAFIVDTESYGDDYDDNMGVYGKQYNILRVTADGDVLWNKSYGGEQDDAPKGIIQTADGGFLVVGESRSLGVDLNGDNHGDWDAWVIKLKADGSLEWQKSYGGNKVDRALKAIATADGYIIVGNTQSNKDDLKNTSLKGGVDGWIFKINTSGVLQWSKIFGGKGNDFLNDIIATNDGNFMVMGTSSSSDINGHHGDTDIYLIKIDKDGNSLWQKVYGGTKNEDLNETSSKIVATADGGYTFVAYTSSTDGDVTNNHGSIDGWLVKINATGAIEWQKTIGGAKTDRLYGITLSADGGYLLAFQTNSIDGDFASSKTTTDIDALVLKVDSKGNYRWQKRLGGKRSDEAYSILPSNDGYLVFASTTSSDGDITKNYGGEDVWLIFIE